VRAPREKRDFRLGRIALLTQVISPLSAAPRLEALLAGSVARPALLVPVIEASATFAANIEVVPGFYQRPRDPKRPQVCLDKMSKQLIIETRADYRRAGIT
jgi:hypothetical protein